MNATVTNADFIVPELLERMGARLGGRNRADCPHCKGKRTVSFTPEVFNCHHAGCDFRGNAYTLAKCLGLARTLSRDEEREWAERRSRARRLAHQIAVTIKARRIELSETHRRLVRFHDVASAWLRENQDDEIGWSALAHVYRLLPSVRAELTILEDTPVAERIRFLNESPAAREKVIEHVMLSGGLMDGAGKFRELPL